MKCVLRGSVLALLGLAGQVLALPRLGDPLPPHPWTSAPAELVVVYSHDCGDLGPLWRDVLAAGLPVRAVNAEDIPSSAPKGVGVWRGPQATDFSRQLKVRVYPSILLVRSGHLLNLWEGTIDLGALRALL